MTMQLCWEFRKLERWFIFIEVEDRDTFSYPSVNFITEIKH